jgi:uracil-DNA glycosylase
MSEATSTQKTIAFVPKKRKTEYALNATQAAKLASMAKEALNGKEAKVSPEEVAWLASLPKLSTAYANLLPRPTLYLPDAEGVEDKDTAPQQGLMIREWRDILAPEFKRKYWVKLCVELDHQQSMGARIIPSIDLIFSALNLCPPNDVRVVILAQDPYPRANHACGIALSVPHGVEIPPSLEVIYQEINRDIPDYKIPNHGCLEHWCKQGVLLLNTILTTVARTSNAHKELGWEKFTDAVISSISNRKTNVVFLLWGYVAQEKLSSMSSFPFKKHLVLKAGHPSPKSTGGMNPFIGCKHFSKCNTFLKSKGKAPILW